MGDEIIIERIEIIKRLRKGYKNFKKDPDAWAYSRSCLSCRAEGGWAKSESGANRMWNMRTSNERKEQEGK